MAGENVCESNEALFERHSAIFVDKKDDDGVFARLQRRFSERHVEDTFRKFYDGIVSCDLTNQWIAQNGDFEARLGWLKMDSSIEEQKDYIERIFYNTYGFSIGRVKIIYR